MGHILDSNFDAVKQFLDLTDSGEYRSSILYLEIFCLGFVTLRVMQL